MIRPRIFEDPEHWYNRADAARQVAENLDDPQAKQTMLSIAKSYERLARMAEAQRRIRNDKTSR